MKTMVIQKHFDLGKTDLCSNLSDYIGENEQYAEQITDKPMRWLEYHRTKNFEMIMYWAVYYYEISDIIAFQEFIQNLVSTDELYSRIEFLIREYLNDKSKY